MGHKRGFSEVLVRSLLASFFISIGCIAYLSAENKVVGAVLFSIALLSICYLEGSLFTGMVGFRPLEKETWIVLIFNLLYCILIGCALFSSPLGKRAASICSEKLLQPFADTFFRSFCCGAIMYIAVYIFKVRNSPLGILIGIPCFILSGFEHSIADTFYFSISLMIFSWKSVLYLLLVVIGNSLGSMFVSLSNRDHH